MSKDPFDNCKTAELHLLDRVQAFGGLLAIDEHSGLTCACSANIQSFTGKDPAELLGRSWTLAFDPDQVGTSFQPAAAGPQNSPHIIQSSLNGQTVLIANHSRNQVSIVEVEAAPGKTSEFEFAERIAFLQALSETDTPESAATLLMNSVAGAIQFDRVMLYKFLPDWHGDVIAESLSPGIGGFLGLRFPASDLPANARRLYLINRQRIIADVGSDTFAIEAIPGLPPLDLTLSQMRAAHPVHIEYLKNLGVAASFSVSVQVAGQLWGLIACHHLTPKRLSLRRRQLCEELARMAAIHMTGLNALSLERTRARFRETQAEILGAIRAQEGNKRAIVSQLSRIRSAFGAHGVVATLNDENFHSGQIPDDISWSALKNSLETHDRAAISASSTIDPALAQYPALIRFASGILYIPLAGGDCLVLMRSEEVETVKWAGKPRDTEVRDETVALTPRASFQTWSEQVRGSSEAWSPAELEAAAKLREQLTLFIDQVELETMASRDHLTGLANRPMFEKAVQNAIKLAITDGRSSAVFALDLDRFKPVNDSMGHAAGDELLVEVANRLTVMMRVRDSVARLGGDEFGIVQSDLRRPEDAEATARRILTDIGRPFVIQGQKVEIGVSIGVTMCPLHAVDQDELLENADLALYQAKLAGRNTFKSFTGNMASDKEVQDSTRRNLIADMGSAGAMWLAYQPVINAKTRALQSFEACARWQHPQRGELRARDFLHLVEHCHLAVQFAEWSIRKALQQGLLWMRQGLPLVPVTVNISAGQFVNVDLVGVCGSLSRELGIGLEWLRFDLDETALHVDLPRASAKIAALAALGVLTNIDRFGQGLVALHRVVDLKFAQLKITSRYFQGGSDAARNEAMVAIIRSIGKVMNIPVVATQIETEAMESRAISSGIEYLQGYRISPPLPPETAEGWIRNRTGPAAL
jgi:diguanylate cyclase (GGDEF)-like protein